MKKFISHSLCAAFLTVAIFSCKQENKQVSKKAEIPADILEAANKWKILNQRRTPFSSSFRPYRSRSR